MAFRRVRRAGPTRFRPPMPPELVVYNGADWGAPPWDGSGPEWEAGHRAAYGRYQQAGRDWFDEHGHLPIDPAAFTTADQPWCGEFDEHDCLGADCSRRPTARNVGAAGQERGSDE
ncbi:Uncharacterised protein [Mycobacteroides abscessus subsp. abscessus]|uniref:hypothetical protein n=1 Tax=Mycobacteroides abscessus TaxID=36809 RepID=UPI000929F91C|nr:hypothetical protein [Mycobacteroides abscessus]SIA00069.1 Uncharacterised protein [Mycobacteroides abscessus subsp. abscessus]SIA00161.1 Uncharacterised protein [Mycobacteroides abscessus subsp. abscessus]